MAELKTIRQREKWRSEQREEEVGHRFREIHRKGLEKMKQKKQMEGEGMESEER